MPPHWRAIHERVPHDAFSPVFVNQHLVCVGLQRTRIRQRCSSKKSSVFGNWTRGRTMRFFSCEERALDQHFLVGLRVKRPVARITHIQKIVSKKIVSHTSDHLWPKDIMSRRQRSCSSSTSKFVQFPWLLGQQSLQRRQGNSDNGLREH